jgi:hypothetical protein
MINKPSHDEEAVWIFGFRYALGRNTTAPWTVSRFLRSNIERIGEVFLQQIARDIQNHFRDDPLPEDWQMLFDAIQAELIKRIK